MNCSVHKMLALNNGQDMKTTRKSLSIFIYILIRKIFYWEIISRQIKLSYIYILYLYLRLYLKLDMFVYDLLYLRRSNYVCSYI